jgi:hypothetical protein
MNKKLTLTGIILALLLITVNSAFASLSITNTDPGAGNPGTTVTGSLTVADSDSGADTDSISGVSFSMGTFTGVTDTTKTIAGSAITFSPSTISSLADGATSTSITSSVAIPASQDAQTYQGTLTVNGTEGGSAISNTVTLSVVVNSLTSLDVLIYDNTTALEIIGEEGESGLTATFDMKNTGNQALALTAASFDLTALDLTDNDNDAITATFSSPGTINPGETKTITITSSYASNIDLDTYGGIVTVKSGSTTLDTFKLDLKVHPEICEDGIVKDGNKAAKSTSNLDMNIKEPDSGDDFKPGDEIKIEVKVGNEDDDNMDVVVEAILYNLDEDEEVATEESSSDEIKDGDEETFEFDLKVPKNYDGDDSDTYLMFIKVSEDGDEDQNCNFDSKNMDFKRNKDDVVVRSTSLSPNPAKPGDIIELVVDIENAGSRDQEDSYVKITNNELGINLKSTVFDLDKAGDSDDDISRRFSLNIPVDAIEKDYLIDIGVFDDRDDAYDNGQEFVTLTVRKGTSSSSGGNSGSVSGNNVNLNVVSQTSEISLDKKNTNLHLLFTNGESEDLTANVEITLIGDWADPIVAQTVNLRSGDNNLYFNLKPKDIEEGTYSATVTARSTGSSNFDTETFSLNYNVVGGGFSLGSFGGSGSTVFWIIGDIVLIVVALFFIKLVFFGRK